MKRKFLFNRLAGAGVITAALLAVVAATAVAEPAEGARRNRSSRFNMLRSASVWVLQGNRVECGLWNAGEVCVDIFNSPTGGGGNWPVGSPNQYIFNSGLQIAGIVPYDSPFADWAGDTVGAFYFDARGTQPHAEAVTDIYSSLTADDVADWPNGAIIRDADVYNPALLGRQSISQEDSWTRYYDGPNQLSGRAHPMGILVEQRSLAWNFPEGNQDIIFFAYEFTNITASDPAAYSGLDASIQSEVAAIAAEWVSRTEARLGIDLPSGGVQFDSVFAAFAMDPDVGINFRQNASTAILPFNMGVAYNGSWDEPSWFYDPSIFRPPFGPFPGFIGVKYLKSPINPATGEEQGLSLFSNTTNSSRFPDPVGVSQLWRYLSGRIDENQGDPPCDVNPPIDRKLCATVQIPDDTRFYQSSGPLTLLPGGSAVIVVAYVHAAPIDAVVRPFFRQFMAPGIPSTGAAFAAGDTLRNIDRATGWASHNDDNQDGVIQQDEVVTVPGSLLWKAMVAQTLFDVQFLLPFAPEAPDFFLVPGDQQVTIVWQPSVTETIGDPYYDIASQPASALFDPNYRFNDVEGYRIYKGRTPAQLQMIAQFDYTGTAFTDYTGNWAYAGQCAPELGVTVDCSEFANWPIPSTTPIDHDLTGEAAQVKPGARVLLLDGSVSITESIDPIADAGFLPLSNSGVPFAFIDEGVLNSLTYYYAVSAFDYNSVVSGPGSLESSILTKAVVPQNPSPQSTMGTAQATQLLGADGTVLDPSAPSPAIDPVTGKFAGPMPPTNGIEMLLGSFLPDVVNDGTVTLTIDDIVPGATLNSELTTYYFTVEGESGPSSFTVSFQQAYSETEAHASAVFVAIPLDPAKAELYGGADGYSLSGEVDITVPGGYTVASWGRGAWNVSARNNSEFTGPRWWAGAANETMDNPNSGNAAFRAGNPIANINDINRTAGGLPGVDSLWHPSSYVTVPSTPMRNFEGVMAGVVRAADFEVTWGDNGAIASVFDLTHQVPVPFTTDIGPGWGFMNNSSFAGVDETAPYDQNNSLLTWTDPYCLPPAPEWAGYCEDAAETPQAAVLEQTAVLNPIAIASSTAGGSSSLTATGQGFILYLNGHYYLMQMTALPASGTVWYARYFAGYITGKPEGTDVSGGGVIAPYEFTSDVRPPAVPGLRLQIAYSGTSFDAVTTAEQLDLIHTVPDPYYATNSMEVTPSQKVMKFVNLPPKAIIRIYSVSGVLVDVIEHNDPAGGSEVTWDVRNRNNQFVASGVYFFHVETEDGNEKLGRFTVINSGSIVIQR